MCWMWPNFSWILSNFKIINCLGRITIGTTNTHCFSIASFHHFGWYDPRTDRSNTDVATIICCSASLFLNFTFCNEAFVVTARVREEALPSLACLLSWSRHFIVHFEIQNRSNQWLETSGAVLFILLDLPVIERNGRWIRSISASNTNFLHVSACRVLSCPEWDCFGGWINFRDNFALVAEWKAAAHLQNTARFDWT